MIALEFNYQVTRQHESLRSFAHSLTANTDDAQDLLQETILKALKYREKFMEQTNLKAWLFTIMKNTFINNYRRSQRARILFDYSNDNHLINSGKAYTASAVSELNMADIKHAITELEDEYRVPFLHHSAGYKYKEIAEEMNLPIGTVKSRIFTARKRLMETLKEFDPAA